MIRTSLRALLRHVVVILVCQWELTTTDAFAPMRTSRVTTSDFRKPILKNSQHLSSRVAATITDSYHKSIVILNSIQQPTEESQVLAEEEQEKKIMSIEYSIVWEDWQVLCEALDIQSDDVVGSILSAGDNILSILSQPVQPERIIAFDTNLGQIYLFELKCKAIRTLNRHDFRRFIGEFPPPTPDWRTAIYREKLREGLSKECIEFWDDRIEQYIAPGVATQGRLERFLQRLKDASAYDDREVYMSLIKEGFGKGRDPKKLSHAQDGLEPGEILWKRVTDSPAIGPYEAALRDPTVSIVPEFPYVVSDDAYERTRAGLDRVEVRNTLLSPDLELTPKCTKWNLSDIFEYMDVTTGDKTWKALAKNTPSGGGRAICWELFVPRTVPEPWTEDVKERDQLRQQDRIYFYGGMHIAYLQ